MENTGTLKIRKELKKFYNEKLNHYRRTNNDYQADRLAAADIRTKINESKGAN